MVRVAGWAELPWLVHGFSTRAGGRTTAYGAAGELNLGFTAEDSRQIVAANRELLLAHLGTDAASGMVGLHQTHSSVVHRVDQSDVLGLASTPMLEGDGLMTDAPGVLLGVLTADCVPVLVVDTRRRVVAAFHAGWRGTLQQIVEQGVTRMRDEFGSAPGELLAAVGPAIGGCCYAVGAELRDQFEGRFAYGAELFFVNEEAEIRLDLAEANRRQLLEAGLDDAVIRMTGTCTSCQTARFFSHRAEHGRTGRMMAVVGVRSI
jgi:YfiH family protein